MKENKTLKLNIRITEEEVDRLKKFAELANTTVSVAVREMVKEHINVYKDPRSKDDDLNTWKLWDGKVASIRLPKAYLDYTKEDAWGLSNELREKSINITNTQQKNLLRLVAHFSGVLGGMKASDEQRERIEGFINEQEEKERIERVANLLADLEKNEREFNLKLIKNAEQIIKGNNDELKEALREAIDKLQPEGDI